MFGSRGIDLERFHTKTVTVACDRVLATSRFASFRDVSRPVRGLQEPVQPDQFRLVRDRQAASTIAGVLGG
jgi:hypothetical protein